jgi:hypothetical protein
MFEYNAVRSIVSSHMYSTVAMHNISVYPIHNLHFIRCADMLSCTPVYVPAIHCTCMQVIGEPVFLAGNSLGGHLSVMLAVQRPALCRCAPELSVHAGKYLWCVVALLATTESGEMRVCTRPNLYTSSI